MLAITLQHVKMTLDLALSIISFSFQNCSMLFISIKGRGGSRRVAWGGKGHPKMIPCHPKCHPSFAYDSVY